MLISVVTVELDRSRTVASALENVAAQDHGKTWSRSCRTAARSTARWRSALEVFDEEWGRQYLSIAQVWCLAWQEVDTSAYRFVVALKA